MKHLWFERGAYASKKARHYIETEFSPEKITKIAVIRHAALGDQVIVRPFLIEARKLLIEMVRDNLNQTATLLINDVENEWW